MAKKLLNEATIRRFQSLANISPINEMSYKEEKEEEKMEETVEAVEETIEEGEENLEEAYMEADEEPGDAPEPEMPMDSDEDMDMGEGGVMELTREEAELLAKLGDMAREELEGMGADEESEMPMDDAPPAPEMEDEMPDEMPMEEALAGINYIPSQGEIVNEVARRVARRLAEAQKAEKKMNEALGRK